VSTLSVSSFPLDGTSPAQRLRRTAAAVRVSLRWWGIHRALTTQQKEELGAAAAADTRLLTAGKRLIDTRHEAVRGLTAVRTRIGQFWRGVSLPYVEPGIRLIRQSDIERFVHQMEGFRTELSEAEEQLEAVYDQVKADARSRLGRLYNPADYPEEVRGLFQVSWDFPSVEPPSYLMQVAPEVYAEERQRVAARFEEAVRLAEQTFATEFSRLLAHLTERLSSAEDGQRKVFRDSAVSNLSEFFGRFRSLNVSSNSALDALVEEAHRIVQGVTPGQLRDSQSLRQDIAGAMAQVQTQVDRLIVEAPRRRLVRARPSHNGGANGIAD
jgi:hypothetical protein